MRVLFARLRCALARRLCPEAFDEAARWRHARLMLEDLRRWCATDPAEAGAAADWVLRSVEVHYMPWGEFCAKGTAWHVANRPQPIDRFRETLRDMRRPGGAA